jgi:glycosyltransferase involved in cell wall biosynthesis
MVRNLTIGLMLFNDENWIGGTYYVSNLISSLGRVREDIPHKLLVFTSTEDDFQMVRDLDNRVKMHRIGAVASKTTTFRRLNILLGRGNQCDILYPFVENPWLDQKAKRLRWIPDLQVYSNPQFYSMQDEKRAKQAIELIVASRDPIVLSSQSTLVEFKRIFPDASNKVFVLHFAVTLPPFIHVEKDMLVSKYSLPDKFLFLPNQFWKHKNHLLVVESLRILNSKGSKLQVVMTGKENDHRNPDHFKQLLQKIEESGLSSQIKILGFIPRAEQLKLMSISLAVLQPSLSEGWSTSIEDAKSMGKFIVASDLDVHKEQLVDYEHALFDKNNALQLAEVMQSIWYRPIKEISYNYDQKISLFGSNFLKICKSI